MPPCASANRAKCALLQLRLYVSGVAQDLRASGLLRRCIDGNVRFVRVVQESKEAVILFLSQRIVLMVVTLGALYGHPEDSFADRVDAVEHRLHAELFRVYAALFVDHRVTQETGGHLLILRGIRQQIARNLLDHELVVRHIAIERMDHPIAVEPHQARRVFFVAVGIGIAGGVQPVASPALAVTEAKASRRSTCFS